MQSQEIKINDIWNNKKQDELRKFILFHSRKQTKERKLINQLLSIQYKMEDLLKSKRF
jgi:antitoxin HigA-1